VNIPGLIYDFALHSGLVPGQFTVRPAGDNGDLVIVIHKDVEKSLDEIVDELNKSIHVSDFQPIIDNVDDVRINMLFTPDCYAHFLKGFDESIYETPISVRADKTDSFFKAQHRHALCASILAQAKEHGIYGESAIFGDTLSDTDTGLLRVLMLWPWIRQRVSETKSLTHGTRYLLNLDYVFDTWWTALPCNGAMRVFDEADDGGTRQRLAILQVSAAAIRGALAAQGIKAPDEIKIKE
jgi:hypothetical protein